MNIDFIKGIIVPILTPIDENEVINETKLRQMVNHVIDGGVSGILAYGSNGEFYMLEESEMKHGLKIILDETNNRVPVYCGIGAISTKKGIRQAKMAQEMGVDGISVLQPMFIKPNAEELTVHFSLIADAVPGLPVLLYNNPARTGYNLSVDVVQRLVKKCSNIVGIKDSSGDMTLTADLIYRIQGERFKVLGGKDTLILSSLVYGAVGCVATTANIFPELVKSIYEKYMEGDLESAKEAQSKLHPIRLAMDKASFPVGTKDLANIMGLDVGEPYCPNKGSQVETINNMKEAIIKSKLL